MGYISQGENIMALIQALSASKRTKNANPTSQFDGIKLQKEDVGELYEILGLDAGSPGSEAFEAMIEKVTGEESPDRVNKSSDGSKFIGKKLSIKAPDEESTVFDNHVALCEKLGIPANSSGAQVFRHLLSSLPEVKAMAEAASKV